MLAFNGVEVFPGNTVKGTKGSGQCTGKLPDSIPVEPKAFVAKSVSLYRSASALEFQAATEESAPKNSVFTFVMPEGLEVGSHPMNSNQADPKSVTCLFLHSAGFDGPIYPYIAYSGTFNVTHFTKPNVRLAGTFAFKTIGGKEFSGTFDVSNS